MDGIPSGAPAFTRSAETLPYAGIRRLRIAIVYDCLYPHTIGGAERWYRNLAVHLAQRYQVTYLTRTQWRDDEGPDAPAGVRVIGLGRFAPLYTQLGRRRISPPLRFGWNVFVHLIRNRRNYDVVHICSFPYFPMLFASAMARFGGPPVVTDWIEVWPPEYWSSYIGRLGGWIGTATQKLCIKVTDQAFTFSDSTAATLRHYGYGKEPVILRGMFDGDSEPTNMGARRSPVVVYIGRHIPEKRVTAIPAAIALARETAPDLRAVIFGDGPERAKVLSEIDRLGLASWIECPGFADWRRIAATLRQAMCLLLPSRREGYGLVVLEAAARGTPSIVVKGPNNAATAFIEDGINGYVAASDDPAELARSILSIYNNAAYLASSTSHWFKQHESIFRIENSLVRIEEAYRFATGRSRINNA